MCRVIVKQFGGWVWDCTNRDRHMAQKILFHCSRSGGQVAPKLFSLL